MHVVCCELKCRVGHWVGPVQSASGCFDAIKLMPKMGCKALCLVQ